MNHASRIYVAGHHGLVGSAIVRQLRRQGYRNIIRKDHDDLDLTRQSDTEAFFTKAEPEYVFIAAGVNELGQNGSVYPGQGFYENMMITLNVIHSSFATGVQKLFYIASSDIYPEDCPQPMRVEDVVRGQPAGREEGRATAQRTAIQLCSFYRQQYGCKFIVGIACELYGRDDCFPPHHGRAVPVLTRRIYEAVHTHANQVKTAGIDDTEREFMFCDDAADAAIFLMNNYIGNVPLNIGTGESVSIPNLANMISTIAGYRGDISFVGKASVKARVLNSSPLHDMGWKAGTPLMAGLRKTYAWYGQCPLPFAFTPMDNQG